MWFYCTQAKHCQDGMVGVINPYVFLIKRPLQKTNILADLPVLPKRSMPSKPQQPKHQTMSLLAEAQLGNSLELLEHLDRSVRRQLRQQLRKQQEVQRQLSGKLPGNWQVLPLLLGSCFDLR
jgi:hypothetical protein